MKSGEDLLQQLVKVFPFLLELPEELLLQIDTSQFYLPSPAHLPYIRQAEQVLQAYVMLYLAKRPIHIPSGEIHLCKILAPAPLSDSQLALLQQFEQEVQLASKVHWVAYAKPLALHRQPV